MPKNKPNLQRPPIRTKVGRSIQNAFATAYGRFAINIDFSGAEIRVATKIAKDLENEDRPIF